jgi:RNA polymerase sigma-70 factor, ECF subfamily
MEAVAQVWEYPTDPWEFPMADSSWAPDRPPAPVIPLRIARIGDGPGPVSVPVNSRNGTPSTVPTDQVLSELLSEHATSMFRLARSIVRDAALAEDVVQESLMKAWQSAESFRGDASLKSWALRITHNTAISMLRRRRDEYRSPEQLPDDPDNFAEPSRQVSGRLMVDDLWVELDKLDPVSRSITVLREVEGLTYEEISEALGLPLPTVKTRLFRARKALASALEEWR